FPEPPQVLATITDVLDMRPSYEIVALHAPIGLPGERTPGGRACDRQARKLLGTRRGAAVTAPPSRSHVYDASGEGLSAVVRAQLARIREVQRDVASYHQRSVFEVHPVLGYFQLNDDTPLRYGKRTHLGVGDPAAVSRDGSFGFGLPLLRRPATAGEAEDGEAGGEEGEGQPRLSGDARNGPREEDTGRSRGSRGSRGGGRSRVGGRS